MADGDLIGIVKVLLPTGSWLFMLLRVQLESVSARN
jgi:hypothetical protein